MKRFLPQVKNWRDIVLIIYTWLVLMCYAFAYIDFTSYEPRKRLYFITVAEIIFIAALYFCPKILRWAESLTLKHEQSGKKIFVRTWLIIFSAFLAMYIIFYPGGFNPDSIDQYGQAIGATNFNDWHPVLHTLFAFVIPLKISGGWIGSIALFQIIIFSLALAYMFSAVIEFSNKIFTRSFLIYMLVSPGILGISLCVYKDAEFSVMAMLSMTFAAKIYFTGGQWLNKPQNIIVFIIVLTLTTIFRHNAILFTFPLLIAVMLFSGRRKNIFMLVSFFLLIFLIRGPLYSFLNVEAPGYRKYESLGASMSIITTAAKETPEFLDDDIVIFARELTRDKVEEAGYIKMLGMVVRCFKQSPLVSLRTFCELIGRSFGIAGAYYVGSVPYIAENDYGIKFGGIYSLERVFYAYTYGSMMTLKHIFWHTGVINLVIIILLLAKCHDFKKFCLVSPVLIYNLGTTILSRSNEFRFFAYSFLILPLIIIILMTKNFNERN